MIAAKALGKPVHSTTSTKISHTWLASHTGVIERSTRSRTGAPFFSSKPAVRSQKPPPKSAPPKIA